MEEDGGPNDYTTPVRKCGTIFLIDCHARMFLDLFEDPTNECDRISKFQTAIKACKSYYEKIIHHAEKELIGVVFFGTEGKDEITNTRNVAQLVPLGLASAENYLALNKVQETSTLELMRKYEPTSECSLGDILWYCVSLFSKCELKMGDKRIVLITDSDCKSRTFVETHQARKRASDLKGFGVKLQVFKMGDSVDETEFFEELVKLANNEETEEKTLENPMNITSLEQLYNELQRMQHLSKCFARLKLDMGEGITFGLSLYSLYKEEKVLSTTLDRATNESIKSVRQTYDEVTGELLLPSDVVESVNVGGGDVVFTNEDKAALKKIMEPGFTLLGFMSSSSLDPSLHCGETCFACPAESLVTGSAAVVKALVDQCLELEKVLLCSMTSRSGAHIKYVLLSPSHSVFDGAGFHVVILPFDDDVREITRPDSPNVKEGQVELARMIVQKITKKGGFSTGDINNPKNVRILRTVTAFVHEKEIPTDIKDDTVPDIDRLGEALGDLSDNFVRGFQLESNPTSSTSKRGSTTTSSLQPKRQKIKTFDCIDNVQAFLQEFKQAIVDRKVNRFRMLQLQQFLTLHNVSIKGKLKPQLIEDVYNVKI